MKKTLKQTHYTYYSTTEFEKKYTYQGSDLGFTYSKDKTSFRLWAPTAQEAYVNLYISGDYWKDDLQSSVRMSADKNGTWSAIINEDLEGTYYTFSIIIDGSKIEACDPYARTTGVNGHRAMVLDLTSTNPENWDKDTNPHRNKEITDAIIYELHIRDFSSNMEGGIYNSGKYLAFTEKGRKTTGGAPTGIDYLKELGITHVHLLPFYDFGSVDENNPSSEQFNWGYDPVNFNVPEGSYSSDPHNGFIRVKETKEMIKALHDNNLAVIMDVVYNHVFDGESFCFNRLVPGYFSRINSEGIYSNGSGCGNDTASERSMVRKYIVDSVCYWANEYHIDGFRFDLVGLLDTDTINTIVSTVHKTHPDVIFYGEGWSMDTAVTKEGVILATQYASTKTPDFAYFNDNMRDGLKGSAFDAKRGWASGSGSFNKRIVSSFLAQEPWSSNPKQIVQYASCHDNNTLFDRIAIGRPDLKRTTWIKMSNLAAAFYIASQGIVFMQAGEEILRTKLRSDGFYESNSFNSGDAINNIKWGLLDEPEYRKNLEFYKGLLAFRKKHGLLRLTTAEKIKKRIFVMETSDERIIAFKLNNLDKAIKNEPSRSIVLIFNPTSKKHTIPLPEGTWNVCVNGTKSGTETLATISGNATVAPFSPVFLVMQNF